MKVRLSVKDDLPEVVNIYNEYAYDDHVNAEEAIETYISKSDWFFKRKRNRPVLVAEDNGIIIGWLSMDTAYPGNAYKRLVSISIYISKSYRSKGVGNKLLQESLSLTHSLSIDVVVTFIFEKNIKSINFFKGNGFSQWGMLPEVAMIKDKKQGLVIMGLSILSAPTN